MANSEEVSEEWECDRLVFIGADGQTLEAPGLIQFSTSSGPLFIVANSGVARNARFCEVRGETRDGFLVHAEETLVKSLNVRISATEGYSSTATLMPLRCALRRKDCVTPWTRRDYLLTSANFHGEGSVACEGARYTIADLRSSTANAAQAQMRVERDIEGDDHIESVLPLLKLAQRSQLAAPIMKAFAGDLLIQVQLVTDTSQYWVTNPLIPRQAQIVADYLGATLSAYRNHDAAYELHRLIDYYCLSAGQEYVELKFILASVFMEAFKFYWARTVGKKPPIVKASTGIIRGFEKSKNKKGGSVAYSFEELLSEACASLGYTTQFTFIEDRNALFHSGAPGAHQSGATNSADLLRAEVHRLYAQIDDILLRILGYRGPILRWDAPNAPIAFSP